MSTSSAAHDARSAQEARRRKRKERAARAQSPELKNIVSGAGQPLDPGVRREMEETLGHDLSRVRLHTDRDAAALTELLGADAVAVGQDIFFREGAYQVGSTDGRRLLAHELLHTVQNPDGLGALRAGRDPGAVSLPAQPIEREAEAAAQEVVRGAATGESSSAEPAKVKPGQATPGWLRYATVDAERQRVEKLDPATLVGRLANDLARSLRGDPQDRSKRVRLQLARMSPELQDSVLDRLERRMSTPDYERLVGLVDEQGEQSPLPLEASVAPHSVPDAIEVVEQDRDSEASARRAERENTERSETDRRDRREVARRKKAQEPQADGDAPVRSASEESQESQQADAASGPTGQDLGGAPQQAEQGRQAQGDPQPLRVESEPDSTSQDDGGTQDTSRTQEASRTRDTADAAEGRKDEDEGEGSQAEQQKAQAAEAQRAEDEHADPESMQSAAVKPASVDMGAAKHDDLGIAAVGDASIAESDQDSGDASDREESDADQALQNAEDLVEHLDELLDDVEAGLAEDEKEERAEQSRSAEDLDVSTADAAGSAASDSSRESDRPPVPRSFASDAEAIVSALADSDIDEAEPTPVEPESDQDRETDQAIDQEVGHGLDDETESEAADESEGESQESEDGDPASEMIDAAEPSTGDHGAGGDGTGPVGEDPRKLVKSDEDARGQATGTSSPGGGSSGSGGDTDRTPAKGPAAMSAATVAETFSRPSAARSGGGGDTGVTPPAVEVRSAPPKVDAPPQHESARPDDDKPVTVKAAPRGKGGGRRPAGRSGGGGGGGGGGAAAKPKKEAPPPNVSNASPEDGLATAATLRPHQALKTLKGVNTAVGRSVDKERGDLENAPPTMERPVGSPMTVRGGPQPAAPGEYTKKPVGKVDAPQGKTPEIKGEKTPEGELPGADLKEPSWWDVGLAIGGALVRKALSKVLPIGDVNDSIDDLPTADKGLQGAKVGDAPKLPLKDDSDPQRTHKQARLLDDKSAELHAAGRDDADRPMGEDEIYPDVPKETLTAKISGGKGQGGGKDGPAENPGAGVSIEAASAVAQHDQGPQIKRGFGESRKRMTTARREKESKARKDRHRYEQNVKREVDKNTSEQDAARTEGRTEIAHSRGRWRKEQDDKLAEVDGKKGKKLTKVRDDVKNKQDKTDKDVDKRTKDDQKKIHGKRTDAEHRAVRRRDEKKKDSGNWIERGIDWVKKQFTELKDAIKGFFKSAREAVQGIIDDFKKQVSKLIDDARKWVVDQINDFADELIRLGDDLLKDYPAMQAKWRNTINGLRDKAIEKVNKAADFLKAVANNLIDQFGGWILDGLNLMEKGLLSAVDYVEGKVVGALEAGAALLKSLGEWKAIAEDILKDPGGWLSKAKDAASTGSKQYLFQEIKTAVKEWFNEKIQAVVGISGAIFQKLIKGGTTKEEMGKMAWDAAVPQLPMIIGELVIKKVVAKLIPGVGWVMAVIDAIKTAYDSLSAILRSFGLVMNFLKLVKSGRAARPFAQAVASGVVALLELIYQELLSGIGKYMGKVARTLRNRAKKQDKKDPKTDKKPDPKKPAPKQDPKQDPKKASEQDPKKGPEKDPAPPKRKPSDEQSDPDRPSERKPAKEKDKREDDDHRIDATRGGLTKASDALKSPKKPGRRDPDRRDGKNRDGKNRDGKRPDDQRSDGKDRPDKKRDDPKRAGPKRDRPKRNDRRPDDKRADRRKPKKDRDRRDKDDRRKRRRSRIHRLRDLLSRLWNRFRRASEQRRVKENRQNSNAVNDLVLPKVRFRNEAGELHTLMFDGNGPGADLAIYSTPAEVPDFISAWENDLTKHVKVISEPEMRAQKNGLEMTKRWHKVADKYDRKLKSLDKIYRKTKSRTDRKRREECRVLLETAMKGLARAARKRNYFDIPEPKLPGFWNISKSVRPSTQTLNAGYLGNSVKTVFGGQGQQSGEAAEGQPPGWDYIRDRKLHDSWVRMHLLPERLGGKASGNNLVPARGPRTNIAFYHNIEKQAYGAISNGESIIWYRVEARFGHPSIEEQEFANFPSYIHAAYGGYTKVKGSGKQRDDWRENGSKKGYSQQPDLPPVGGERKTLFINIDGMKAIATLFGSPKIPDWKLAGQLIRIRKKEASGGRIFSDREGVRQAMLHHGVKQVAIDSIMQKLYDTRINWSIGVSS